MAAPRAGRVVIWMTRGAAAAAFAAFMSTAFHAGWTQISTDFPNYYTAAVLVRQRKPLRSFYDWTWFARQMNYAGVERQLGAYTPQTPLTMLPMVGLAGLPLQDAKRVWLVVNLALLAAVIYMLARATGISLERIALLAFCGYSSLAANFLYGQYYVFLLFLITLTFFWLNRNYCAASGFLSGGAFGLKLYTGPLLLYFAAKRKWRSVAGMLSGSACAGALAVALFGWGDVRYYLTHVLPRTLEGGSIDPYNPGVPAISTLLHWLFMREPALNPHPALDAPSLFFFTHAAVQSGLIAFTALGVAWAKKPDHHRDFAWFVILLVLLSTSTASYTFVLLLAPVVLLVKDASPWKSVYLAGSYVLLNANLRPLWLFPKVWLLLLLFVIAGVPYWRAIRARWAVGAGLAILMFSLADARRHMLAYRKEPGRRYEQIAAAPGSLFSGYPVITRAGLFYQGMGDERKGEDGYLLCWLHEGRLDRLGFGGYALHPVGDSADGPVWFELVAHRTSAIMRFDPSTGRGVPSPPPAVAANEGTAVSPDGKWTVFTRTSATSEELWIRNLATGETEELAGGSCNNSSPAWELDSSAIVFASDCGRAFGLPALYRAPIARRAAPSPR
jgi:hypothetical protein